MAQMTPEERKAYMRENFFSTSIEVNDRTRKVLEEYSRIPADQILPHVSAIREKAFAIHPYPCIGMGRFLDLAVGDHVLYPEILARMRDGQQTYLDVGCAFAQDVRRLVADGVDSSRCYGSDLRLDFIDIGYELFRDKDTLRSKFIAADIFDPQSTLHELDGTFDIIGANSFFHLFSWEEQKQAARRVAQLLKPQKDSLLVGRQLGLVHAGEVERRVSGGSRYRHSVDSWKQFWEELGKEAGAQYHVDVTATPMAELRRAGDRARPDDDPNGIRMEFSVRRL